MYDCLVFSGRVNDLTNTILYNEFAVSFFDALSTLDYLRGCYIYLVKYCKQVLLVSTDVFRR